MPTPPTSLPRPILRQKQEALACRCFAWFGRGTWHNGVARRRYCRRDEDVATPRNCFKPAAHPKFHIYFQIAVLDVIAPNDLRAKAEAKEATLNR